MGFPVLELTATYHLLKEQTATLTEVKEKLLSENEKWRNH